MITKHNSTYVITLLHTTSFTRRLLVLAIFVVVTILAVIDLLSISVAVTSCNEVPGFVVLAVFSVLIASTSYVIRVQAAISPAIQTTLMGCYGQCSFPVLIILNDAALGPVINAIHHANSLLVESTIFENYLPACFSQCIGSNGSDKK